jgi:hypothetical protein
MNYVVVATLLFLCSTPQIVEKQRERLSVCLVAIRLGIAESSEETVVHLLREEEGNLLFEYHDPAECYVGFAPKGWVET